MARSPTYTTVRAWILGRIRRHALMRSNLRSMPASMLEVPPQYLLASEVDVADELRALRDEGVIASHSKRWYLRSKAAKR